jgi:transposase-like protein
MLPASPEQAEIRRLQKELGRAQMERGILKKAMAGSTGQRNTMGLSGFSCVIGHDGKEGAST